MSQLDSFLLDYILNLKGGAEKFNKKDFDKLLKSIGSKSSKNDETLLDNHRSRINKYFKKIGQLIFEQSVGRVFEKFKEPIVLKIEFNPFTGHFLIEKSSSNNQYRFSAIIPEPMFQRQCPNRNLQSYPDKFSDGLDSSGLNLNHKKLSQENQDVKEFTKLRRAQPVYQSKVFSNCGYSKYQLELKGPRHYPEFGFSIEGLTMDEINIK